MFRRRRKEPRPSPAQVADQALSRFAADLDGYGPAEALLAALRLRQTVESLAMLLRDQGGAAEAVMVELRHAEALAELAKPIRRRWQ